MKSTLNVYALPRFVEPVELAGQTAETRPLQVLQIVHVAGGTRVTVVSDGITADQQVLNILRVQQPQELFEVGG